MLCCDQFPFCREEDHIPLLDVEMVEIVEPERFTLPPRIPIDVYFPGMNKIPD